MLITSGRSSGKWPLIVWKELRTRTKPTFVQQEYQNTIKAYVEKGYLRKVLPGEKPPPLVWYLPHFAIVKMDKTTTKVRIVFDCSAKYEGVSLNDAIHPGPKLQTELFDVLVRFRQHPIGLACDTSRRYISTSRLKRRIAHISESFGAITKAIDNLRNTSSPVLFFEKTQRQWNHSL